MSGRTFNIAVVPGDGIGPEVIDQGISVLECCRASGIALEITRLPWGAAHYLTTGIVLPPDAVTWLKSKFHAVYLGPIGDPRVPEEAMLTKGIVGGLRAGLDLFVNLRPLRLYEPSYSPLRVDEKKSALDILIVRENMEDLYAGTTSFLRTNTDDEVAVAIAWYTKRGISRAVREAFTRARNRRGRVTLVDKANAVAAHGLWRSVFWNMAAEFPDVSADALYVDACAALLVSRPEDLDVIVTTNMFGDILSDLGAALCGGVGMVPSASVNPGSIGVFAPIHGSAPKYANKNVANPCAAVLAAAMMLEYLGADDAARAIERAVQDTLRSKRLRSLGTSSGVSTDEIGELIRASLKRTLAPAP